MKRTITSYDLPKVLLCLIIATIQLLGGPQLANSAEDLFKDMTPSMTYPKATITHYSATPRGGPICRLEGGVGGKDESPSGIRPLSATITKPGMIKGKLATLTAVPQKGGNSGIYGCFFALPEAYPGKMFYAGDRYGTGSNGKIKVDISSPCTSIVNKSMKSKIVVYDCPGKKGGSGTKIARKPHEPTPKAKPGAKKPEEKIAEAPKSQDKKKTPVIGGFNEDGEPHEAEKTASTSANNSKSDTAEKKKTPIVGGFNEDGDTHDLEGPTVATTNTTSNEPAEKKNSNKKGSKKTADDLDTSLVGENETKEEEKAKVAKAEPEEEKAKVAKAEPEEEKEEPPVKKKEKKAANKKKEKPETRIADNEEESENNSTSLNNSNGGQKKTKKKSSNRQPSSKSDYWRMPEPTWIDQAFKRDGSGQ